MRNSERWTSRQSSPGRLLVMIGRPCAGLRQQLLLKFSSVIAWASSWAWLEYGSSWSTHSFAGEPGRTGKGPPQPPMPVRDCQPFMGASCADCRRWHPRRLQREQGCRGSSLLRPPIRVHSPAHVPLAAGARAAGRRRTCRCDPTRWGRRLCRHARA